MAQGIWLKTGGGVNSEDVTALKKHILKGKTAITADSDDEVISGTMPDNSTRNSNGSVPGVSAAYASIPTRQAADGSMHIGVDTGGVKRINMSPPEGYYPAAHQSHINRPAAELGNATPDKVLEDATYTSEYGLKVQGTMKDCGNGQQTFEVGWDHGRLSMWARLPGRNGYYHIGSNDPWLYISREQAASVIGLNPDHWLDNVNYMGYTGKIPRWVCGTGDVISAHLGQGQWYDDTYAGRGRGIIVRIPNGYRIENANWVFLPSPNLHSINIRAGVNINGVDGTLVDYGAGRVVFSNAAFDNLYFSGVANSTYKGVFYNATGIVQGSIDSPSQYSHFDGLVNGGLQVRVGARTWQSTSNFCSGCVMDKSLDLTPFRTMRVGYYLNGTGKYIGGGASSIRVKACLAPVSAVKNEEVYINNQLVRSFSSMLIKEAIHNSSNAGGALPDNGQRFLDVPLSGVNGQHYISLGAVASKLHNADSVSGTVIFNHIEFIN